MRGSRVSGKFFRSVRARISAPLLALVIASAFSTGVVKKGAPPGPHEQFGGRAEIVKTDIPYVPAMPRDPKLMLDVYSNPHSGLWPAAVMVHGGAWVGGDKTMDNKVYVCKVLAANGYVMFTINYRLFPQVRVKQMVEDVMAAVIWVKQHAREYGADPDRIGIVGGSAGGQLAAVVAWDPDDPFFQPTGNPPPGIDARVKVAALYYPVLDFDRTLKENGKGAADLGSGLFTGKSGAAYLEELKHISPALLVKPGLPPTLFLTGDADSLKLYPYSVAYAQKLRELGIDAELFTARGKDHGFTWNYWEPESVASAMAIVKFFDKYLKQ